MENLGPTLKFLRQQAGYNLLALSEELAVSPSTICNLEAGRRLPSLDMLDRYCQVFHLPHSHLWQLEEAMDRITIPRKWKLRQASRMRAFINGIKAQQTNKFLYNATRRELYGQ